MFVSGYAAKEGLLPRCARDWLDGAFHFWGEGDWVIRLLVADDSPVVREGLKGIVAGCPDMTIVGEVATSEAVLDAVRTTEVDVLLMDVCVPGSALFEMIRQLSSRSSSLHVLIVNVHSEDQHALRVLRSGAAGYLARGHSPSELVEAIRKVARGARHVSHALAEELLWDAATDADRPVHEELSDREYQVLCLLGTGIPLTRIATDLGLSPKTISTYRGRILEKLKLNNSAAIIRYAIEHRLVS
jgi:two-component system, NarL family, invasion response regulator UvrY